MAIDMLSVQTYDCVLMDIQIPVLDGYQATQIIRNELGLIDLPIIAMTANVMAEDIRQALDSGMNGHVGKPIVEADLFACMLKWIPAGLRQPREAPVAIPGSSRLECLPAELPEVNLAQALLNLGGNRHLLAKLLREAYQDHRNDLDLINHSLVQGNVGRAQRIAHTLKSIFGTFGASRLQNLFKQLEMEIKASQLEDVENTIATIDSVLTPLYVALQHWITAQASDSALPKAQHTNGELSALMSELSQLLDDMDPQAHEVALQLQGSLSHIETLSALIETVEAFDFAAAADLIKTLQRAQ